MSEGSERPSSDGRNLLIMLALLILVSYAFTKMDPPATSRHPSLGQDQQSSSFNYGYRMGQEAHANGTEKLWACSDYSNYDGEVFAGCEAGFEDAVKGY